MNHAYEYSHGNVTLRPLQQGDIEYLRIWRNNRENTRYLRDLPYITEEMQRDWFRSLSEARDELYFAIVENRDLNRLVGSLALYRIRPHEAEFGKILIGDDMAHGKGVGRNATIAALRVAFGPLGLDTVRLSVYEENRAAVKAYSQAGFRVVDARRDSGGRNELFMEACGKDMVTRVLRFQRHEDARGQLVALEAYKDVPFEIQRVYYIYGTADGAVRGLHAHKSLEQVLICVHGSCKVLLDDGTEKEVVSLTKPDEGLYISHGVWREMFDFSPGAVLVVLASRPYDESDYIRDYRQFLEYTRKEGVSH